MADASTLHGALIEVYELYLVGNTSDTPDYRFSNGVNELGTDIVWQGATFKAIPIEASGFEMSGTGKLPRPGIKIGNVDQWIGVVTRANDDLVGAKISRRRTFAKYLDAVNFINGNLNADPAQEFPPDIFYVETKRAETKLYIEWELVSACDLSGIRLPRRQIIANVCSWNKVSQCQYVATCDHTLPNCKTNWGADQPLPFGGFPGAGYRRT